MTSFDRSHLPVSDLPPDLRAARDALDAAYELARLDGYRPGSSEMHALRHAETRYWAVRAHVERSRGGTTCTQLGCAARHPQVSAAVR